MPNTHVVALPIYSVPASANEFGFLFCHEYLDLFELLGCKPVRLNKDEPPLLCSNATSQDHSDDLFLNDNTLEQHAFWICRCDDDGLDANSMAAGLLRFQM